MRRQPSLQRNNDAFVLELGPRLDPQEPGDGVALSVSFAHTRQLEIELDRHRHFKGMLLKCLIVLSASV